MKWFIMYIAMFYYNYGYCQIINIPDNNFKTLLINSSATTNITAISCITNSYFNIDSNGNGEIEVAEALAVCKLNIITANISDLSGIEAFTNLRALNCSGNNLTSIDLSQLIHLEHFGCYLNQLTSLDISTLTNLKYLFFFNNQITTIDFSNHPQLEVVYCGNNQLTSLDFSGNPLFHDLGCKNNLNLNTIKINNGAMQIFGATTWLNECWTGNPNLTTICADANEIDILESYLLACGIETSGISITSNCVLGVEEYGIDGVSIYPNSAISNVNITSKNSIKTIELIDVQGRILVSKEVNASETVLDIAGYGNGVYFIKINSDKGSKIEKLIKE